MRILLWHGYLLRGSGSNIYTANVARAWQRAGHDVVVMCQERDLTGFDLDVVTPDIGGLLPVYVYDDYEGFVVKRFVDLTDDELSRYTESNVAAMVAEIERFDPDAIITGHEVMGPYIAKLACTATDRTYVAKLHGSALEYAVKEQARYVHFATEGLGAASHVVGGSNYMVQEAARYIPGWLDRASVVNPGCDVELFRPARDRPVNSPARVGFVGKLIEAKGVHNLISAIGLVDHSVELTIVGYGGAEENLRRQADALTKDEGTRPSIEFAGRLDHGPLSGVLPTFDLLVVPSVVPEAFGMVAAEAAACGVLPLVPGHSGIGEVGATLEEALGRSGLLTFDPSDPVRAIAEGIDRLLAIPERERKEMGEVAVRVAHERWSWEGVAARLLEVASD